MDQPSEAKLEELMQEPVVKKLIQKINLLNAEIESIKSISRYAILNGIYVLSSSPFKAQDVKHISIERLAEIFVEMIAQFNAEKYKENIAQIVPALGEAQSAVYNFILSNQGLTQKDLLGYVNYKQPRLSKILSDLMKLSLIGTRGGRYYTT
ncbi:hypothetical protein GF327_09600 [Candidatus Woesearchaeota archaeon]|nr:hypothetical protein [Candidatus Woesearchaeota archaeon]